MNMDNFQEIHVSNHPTIPQLQNQKHQKFRRNDSLEIESRTTSHVHHSNGSSMAIILQLAFQSLGIVYGDIGTSPFDEERVQEAIEKEIETIEKASRAGVVHLIGENEVIASKGAGFGKRILIDYAYNFLKRNLRQSEKLFDIPHKRMVKVGMTYEL
ncbi:hypothetical protein KIW84_031018 [Lathyrus oleraceus]|uniref:K+ potassium transporter C-terminal domain-containing protein n=1 Tax=Pisum sativum TaxID=3888 RepID=A0A9D4XS25_PEA|nr:hypothetical protein KIW84_031018 [Pisum sativum]